MQDTSKTRKISLQRQTRSNNSEFWDVKLCPSNKDQPYQKGIKNKPNDKLPSPIKETASK